MNIKTLVGLDGYSLLISKGAGNLYSFSIIDRNIAVHSFEGIYPSLNKAIARGKQVIENFRYWQHNSAH